MEARDYVNALIQLGLTQTVVADQTGIPQPTISKVARGEVADVLSRNYRKLQTLYEETLRKAAGAAIPTAQPDEVSHGA